MDVAEEAVIVTPKPQTRVRMASATQKYDNPAYDDRGKHPMQAPSPGGPPLTIRSYNEDRTSSLRPSCQRCGIIVIRAKSCKMPMSWLPLQQNITAQHCI
eukprot:scaffold351770_cov40-Prasinocladus_malaysianus.AAC.3